MGTSYIEYKASGFWSRDSYISAWLGYLISEISREPAQEEWERQLIAHWELQRHIDGGVMSLALDEFISDRTKRDSIERYALSALANCNGFVRRTGELFVQLLKGELQTNESSPIDYF